MPESTSTATGGNVTVPAYASIVDTFLVAHGLGQAGKIEIGGPGASIVEQAGLILDYSTSLHVLNKSGLSFGYAGPTPQETEAWSFLKSLLPSTSWDLDLQNVLAGPSTHRITNTGWYPSGGFSFGFRIQQVIGANKINLHRNLLVNGLAFMVEFVAVLQTQ